MEFLKCKCPYCFKEFQHDQVHFKLTEMIYKAEADSYEQSEYPEEKLSARYSERVDKKFEKYWRNYPGNTPQYAYAKNPVLISNNNGNVFPYDEDASGENGIPANFYKDDDGFVSWAKDEEGNISTERICPHCHNPLVYPYGKYPVKFIAVVGVTTSGKTMYLGQMLGRISDYLAFAGLGLEGQHEDLKTFVKNNFYHRDQILPMGNASHVMTLPITINVIKNKTGEHYTLVFFDIAGENCVKADRMEKYGPFVQNADGMIFLVDPNQMEGFFELDRSNETTKDSADEKSADENRIHDEGTKEKKGEKTNFDPPAVIEAMYNAFLGKKGSKCTKPIAVTFSKSDMLAKEFNENSNVFQMIDYQKYYGKGFQYDTWRDLHDELYKRLKSSKGRSWAGRHIINAVENHFETIGFFAVAALNCELKTLPNKKLMLGDEPNPRRIEEPFLWLLFQLNIIDGYQNKDGKIIGKTKKQPAPKRGLFRRLFGRKR